MLIDDIEYVIFRHPDLAQIREFMIGFGLLELQQTADHLYLRSYGDAPFSYVTAAGDAAFLGMGFRVASSEALAQLAARFDCPASECPHPGGGLYVVGSDPDGRRLEFVFDAKRLAPTPSDGAPILWNDAHSKNRLGKFQRPAYGSSHIQRLGHAAVFTTAPQQLIAWYCENLGMKPSELIHKADETDVLAAFIASRQGGGLDGPSYGGHRRRLQAGPRSRFLRMPRLRRHRHGPHGDGRQGLQTSLGHRPAFLRQSGLRLLDRPGRASMSSISSMETWSTATRQR